MHTPPDHPTSQEEHPAKSALGMDIDGTTTMNPITLVRDKSETKGKGSVKGGVEQDTTGIIQKVSPSSMDGN